MSVFKVNLNQTGQGLLDRDPSTASAGNLGSVIATSLQRTVYITGPNKVNRLLKDGSTFTDVNYYKRYCAAPTGPLSAADAILTLVTDDNSIWFDDGTQALTEKVINSAPAINSGTFTAANMTGTNQTIDLLGTYGGPAVFVQILNNGSVALKIRINGDTNAVFDLATSTTQIFNIGEAVISKIEFGNASGGTVGSAQTIFSVKSVSNS